MWIKLSEWENCAWWSIEKKVEDLHLFNGLQGKGK